MKDYHDRLALLNLELPWTKQPSRWEQYACPICPAKMATKGAWSIHMTKYHPKPVRIESYVDGSICQACCWQFHNRTRLIKHLKSSKHCAQLLKHHLKPLPPAKQQELNDEDLIHELAADDVDEPDIDTTAQKEIPMPVLAVTHRRTVVTVNDRIETKNVIP